MKRLLSVAALLAMTAAPALAQLSSEIVVLAANGAVQKDLGVSNEVAGKLTLLRDEYRAALQKEYQDAGVNPRGLGGPGMTAEQQEKYVAITKRLKEQFFLKAKEAMSNEQYARLRQISIQYRLYLSTAYALISPDIVEELMVTDEQKTILHALSLEYGRGLVFGKASDGGKEKNMKRREEYNAKAVEALTAQQQEALNKMKGDEYDLSKLAFAAGKGK